jgi:glycosyltransferase involved in cell wall biosynthesis
MSASAIRGLSSIIIPCWNQHQFIHQCMAALKEHTRPSWELIIIDNVSTDGTALYLAGLQAMAAVPVTVVTNTRNLGFPAAINQGLQRARGEYLVLLNNDVVVTDGWLDQLIALANAKRGRGEDVTAEHAEDAERRTEGGGGVVGGGSDGRDEADDVAFGAPGADDPATPSPLPTAYCLPPTPKNAIGLVGPMSNYAAPPQLVDRVPYRDARDMHAFAQQWRDEHRGQWFTVPKLSGFCLLMKRAVYDRVGGLDKRFGLGMFDDDDLAERARRAGFELAVAHDLFVHHFGSRTFAGNGIDAGKLLEENARRFAQKWGLREVNGRRVALRPWNGNGESHAGPCLSNSTGDQISSSVAPSRLCVRSSSSKDIVPASDSGERANVSLTMIVKNEENNLPQCLESVRDIFDEFVIVDTGSTDRTFEIARSFGAKVFDFAWVDSFSVARNEALKHATGDFAFWLDADDVVEPMEREKLLELLERLRPADQAAYVVRCACDPSPDGTGGDTVVDHIRLFPLRDDARWTYRVHEQILPALRQAKVPVRWTNLTVRHTGYADPALRARKLERDIRLLGLDLEDRPDDPFVLFNLGAVAVERKEWPKALEFLERSLRGSASTDSIVRKLFALIARAHQMMVDSQRALQTCAKGLKLDREDAELWFRKAVLHRLRGESSDAEQSWRRILGLHRPDQFCSVDQGIFGHLTRRNLAALAAERGDQAGAERLWREVLAECPGDREAVAKLGGVHMPTGAGRSLFATHTTPVIGSDR